MGAFRQTSAADAPGRTPHRYRFGSEWRMTGRSGWAFGILADIGSYPRWWPQIRRVEMLDDTSSDVTIRSLLPYALAVRLRRTVLDAERGILEVAMTGDLAGSSRWQISSEGPSWVTVRFEEEAQLVRPTLRAFEPAARPLFIANHALMMRGCRRGLEAALAGYGVALRGPRTPRSDEPV